MEKNIAKVLLDIKAVFLRPLEPFTWASGIKSPIYCDNRLTLAYPKARDAVEGSLARCVKELYPECEALMGTATAGIPHAAIVSQMLALPMGYVRGESKSHGRENKIEGADPKGKKVVVIEDLISTAGSSIDVVNSLREAGAEVLGIVSIFTYGLKKGIDKLKEANVENHSLTNLDAVIKEALSQNYISEREARMLLKFRENPQDPSWQEVQ
ncbi:MAG: orotate phosphoribosyltransferase [Clostridiales bacterium]|nr:orotate phosphoribosyltransferase [Clostridiales bacterium]